MKEEVGRFVGEIRGVCRKHGFAIAVSGYDSLQVWKLDEGEPELHAPRIEDMTGENA